MKLHAGTTEQFRADARMHRVAEKLRAEYTTQIGHRPAPSEVASYWWFRRTAADCRGKRHLEQNSARAIDLLTQPATAIAAESNS